MIGKTVSVLAPWHLREEHNKATLFSACSFSPAYRAWQKRLQFPAHTHPPFLCWAAPSSICMTIPKGPDQNHLQGRVSKFHFKQKLTLGIIFEFDSQISNSLIPDSFHSWISTLCQWWYKYHWQYTTKSLHSMPHRLNQGPLVKFCSVKSLDARGE